MWRLFTLLILLFWGSMTYLLVQRVYFASGVGEPLAVKEVLDRAAQASPMDDMLDLFHNGKKSGAATLRVRPWEQKGYALETSGNVDAEGQSGLLGMTWQATGKLDAALDCQALSLRMRLVEQDLSVVLDWEKAKEKPCLEVHRAGQLVMDTAALENQVSLLKQMPNLPLPALPGLGDLSSVAAMKDAVQVTASMSQLDIAGGQRQGYSMIMKIMGLYQIEAKLTQAGELAQVDLPEGWQLKNSVLVVLGKGGK